MKNKNLFVLSITALLTLTSCGGKNNNKPVEGLTDLEKSNMEVEFNEITNTCMVENEVKAYVDAMEEQEKTLEKPYHFSSLYGPTDYARMADKADTDDANKDYASTDTGGVDSCQYLGKNGKDGNVPIVVSWDANGLDYEDAKIKFWSTEDHSDVREASVTVDSNGVASAKLANLYRATKYRIQLFDNGDVSQGFEFETADYPRTISMGDVPNVRDIGGYMTSYGVRTTQGIIYRGFEIEDKSGGHGVKYNEKCEAVNQEVMKIGYEIDLRASTELNGRTASALQGCDNYQCLTLVSYENFLKESSYRNLPAIFEILANADQEHVYFHCWGGADRTGMLAFFINAICGVSYTDLLEDFEITSETNNKRCHMHNSSSAHFPKFLNAFFAWDGYDADKTINENCYSWLKDVANVSEENMLKVRQLMIPGYDDNMPQNIPTYTPSSETQEDQYGTWNPAVEDANVKCNYQRKDEARA